VAGARPPAAFSKSPLEIHVVRSGDHFGRIYSDTHPDPLGYSKSTSRFSDPRRRIAASRFGVVYLGESLTVCFLEAVLRDQRDGVIGGLPLDQDEIAKRLYADIEVVDHLRLVDLRDECAIRMGVPTDVHRASKQTLARVWSVAFHEHPDGPDGIIYPSRLNGQTNLAIYGRGVSKLRVHRLRRLIAAPGLANVLDDLSVELVTQDP
jgi:hypothetical protein